MIAVLGSGESAIGAALLAKKNANEVFVSDHGEIHSDTKTLLEKHSIRFEENGHSIDIIGKAKLVIKSPGIPNSSAVIQTLKTQGVDIIGEIEYGFRYSKAQIIGITGSNGKSTVTNMIYQVLKHQGKDVQVGGNFGVSFCRLLANRDSEIVVLELSSFQLEDITEFKPDVSVVLNITADHLDRYNSSIEEYADAKMRIARNQGVSDTIIYNSEDELISRRLSVIQAKQCPVQFSNADQLLSNKQALATFPFRGKHNHFNAMVVLAVAKTLGLQESEVIEGLKNYQGLPHRMEEVARINGMVYINDSKATNVDATYYALQGTETPLFWIVGGVDKGNDYSILDDLVKSKVKMIICLGSDNTKLMSYYQDFGIPLKSCARLEAVMETVISEGEEGDRVLLSPACASFDLFKNYRDRGDQFKEHVFNLIYNTYSCLQ